jgi:hypothetical protein
VAQRLYNVENDKKLELLSELELSREEDAPMSIAADPEVGRAPFGLADRASTEVFRRARLSWLV